MALFAFSETQREEMAVSPDSNSRVNVESEEPAEPRDDREEADDCLRLIPDADERTPEEAGYGHGV
jgi:hypothetical protein